MAAVETMPDLATMLIQYATPMTVCVHAVEVGGALVGVNPMLVANRTFVAIGSMTHTTDDFVHFS